MKRPGHLASTTNELRQKVSLFPCKAWTCPVCSVWKLHQAGQHYAGRLLVARGNISWLESSPEAWSRDRKRLNRVKPRDGLACNWVRIGDARQVGILIVETPNRFGQALPDREAAIRRLGQALRELVIEDLGPGRKHHPITSSEGWDPVREPKKFRLVGWVNTREPGAVVKALEPLGIDPRVKYRSGGKFWDVSFEIALDQQMDVQTALSLECSIKEEET